MGRKVTTSLWYNGNAGEAWDLYQEVFGDDVELLEQAHYTEMGPGEPGSIRFIHFRLFDAEILMINAGDEFKKTEAVSIAVDCDTQEEIDRYWNGLTANGGRESQCGWLEDPFGLSWQINTHHLFELARDPVSEDAVLQAMYSMKKIIIADLYAAAEKARAEA